MKRSTTALVGSHTAAACVQAAALLALAVGVPPAAEAQDPLATPVVYRLAGMDSVRVREGIVYKRADGVGLTMSVAQAAGASADGAVPVILFIHGGPLGENFTPPPTEWGVYRSYVRLAAASGFVGVAFNFRYVDLSEEGLARAASDVVDAIAYVRSHATTFGADPQRICLWAFSGGGPMLPLALAEGRDWFRCLVSYYALLDNPQAGAHRSLVRHPLRDGQVMPPTFIARAGLDSPAINASVDAFVARAQSEGGVFTVANHPTGRHGFDITDDDERSREIIGATFEFVRHHTAGNPIPQVRLGRAAAAIYQALGRGDVASARRLAGSDVWRGPDATALLERVIGEDTSVRLAFQLAREGAGDKAVGLLEWLVERNPDKPSSLDRLAQAYEAAGRKDEAKKAATRLLEMVERTTGLPDATRAALRRSARERLDRLSR